MPVSSPSFPERVTLWKEGSLDVLDFPGLTAYLEGQREGLRVTGPRDIWSGVSGDRREALARGLARARVFRINRPRDEVDSPPLPGEVRVEERMIRGEAEPVGMLYDALRLARLYTRGIGSASGEDLPDLSSQHIVVTYRLIGTFERHDRRYHARTSLYALPSIISTTGLVVAPAKPREYYLAKNLSMGGVSEEELKSSLRGRILEHGDERTTEVMKGYLMQALFYHATGDPFCDEPGCRLFNAHWQEEMLRAQLEGGSDLCERHRHMLAK